MLASIFSLNVLQTALELGCIYALVALALFLSYSILNIADLSTDGCFTLGCAVACQVALTGHPILARVAAMAAAGTLKRRATATIKRYRQLPNTTPMMRRSMVRLPSRVSPMMREASAMVTMPVPTLISQLF